MLTNILSALPSRIRANEMIAGMPAATGGVPLAAHTVTFTTLYVDGFQSANGPVKVLTTDASGLATIQLPPPSGRSCDRSHRDGRRRHQDSELRGQDWREHIFDPDRCDQCSSPPRRDGDNGELSLGERLNF